MTYVSYFPEAKLKPGAPLRPRTHPSAKCSAKGPGVEPKGLVVKKPAEFTVFTQGAGVGKLNVSVWGPGKTEEEVIVQDNQDHSYECQYFPQKQGNLNIALTLSPQESSYVLVTSMFGSNLANFDESKNM